MEARYDNGKNSGFEVTLWPRRAAASLSHGSSDNSAYFIGCPKLRDNTRPTWTVACQAPLSTEFSRQEYWSGQPSPSPGDLPDPQIKLPGCLCSNPHSTTQALGFHLDKIISSMRTSQAVIRATLANVWQAFGMLYAV